MEAHPLRFIRHAGRASEILTVLVTYGFGDFIERVGFRRNERLGVDRLAMGKAIGGGGERLELRERVVAIDLHGQAIELFLVRRREGIDRVR